MIPENVNQQLNPMGIPSIPTFNFGMLPIQQPSRFTILNWFKAMNQESINSVWRANCETTDLLMQIMQNLATAPIESQRPAAEFKHQQMMNDLDAEEKRQQIRTLSANADTAEHQSQIEGHKVREAIGFDESEKFDFDALDDETKKLIMAVVMAKGKK